ncbi:MAG: hypothetical protein WAU39_21340 [Polyangiales bacterium]
MRWMRLVLLVLVAGCWNQGQEPPGDPVGTFEALGLMVQQSCGEAVPAPDPLELVFELRVEAGGRAYWQQAGGSLFVGVQKDGGYEFQVSQSWTVVDPDPFRGYVGCSVTQRDEFRFVVEKSDDAAASAETDADAGAVAAPLTLTGSQTTEIVPVTGSDCLPAVTAGGGSFLSLPCRVEYVLTGTGELLE